MLKDKISLFKNITDRTAENFLLENRKYIPLSWSFTQSEEKHNFYLF